MKKLAFWGVAVSTVATLVAIICVPMLCTYMQNVQSNLQDEISFCRTRAISLRGEYAKLFKMGGKKIPSEPFRNIKVKRQKI
uniref:Nematode cuticle collagen N-terminal domain-containing protein n=1 Tax=Parascaris equorum TaxID=6256 RepID=A0A914RK95_PAREQ